MIVMIIMIMIVMIMMIIIIMIIIIIINIIIIIFVIIIIIIKHVRFLSLETQPDENALENVTRVPLGDLPANSSPSVTCSYDIWQRRDPQNRSFGKGKKKNGLSVNYETTI